MNSNVSKHSTGPNKIKARCSPRVRNLCSTHRSPSTWAEIPGSVWSPQEEARFPLSQAGCYSRSILVFPCLHPVLSPLPSGHRSCYQDSGEAGHVTVSFLRNEMEWKRWFLQEKEAWQMKTVRVPIERTPYARDNT